MTSANLDQKESCGPPLELSETFMQRMGSRFVLIILAIAIVILLYGAALLGLYSIQRKVLFPASHEPLRAADWLHEAQTLTLPTSDGERLEAWFVPPKAGKLTLVYFHGNGGRLFFAAQRYDVLKGEGRGLLAIEYRGYGASSGSPSEAGLLLDGEATYQALLERGIDPKNCVLVADSLGTGVAVALAAKHDFAGLVLDSPFSSVVDVAQERFWMFPVRWLIKDPFHSDERIGAVHAPVLILHGSADQVVPIAFGRRLFALANAKKAMVEIEGAPHLVLRTPAGLSATLDFLAALERKP